MINLMNNKRVWKLNNKILHLKKRIRIQREKYWNQVVSQIINMACKIKNK